MKHLRIVLLFAFSFLALSFTANAQMQTYRVFFANKGISPFIKGSSLYNQTLGLISERALQRRAKVRPADSLITLADAPLYPAYIEDLQKTGAKILLQLRWQNYALIECDSTTLFWIKSRPYVQSIQPTSAIFKTLSLNTILGNTPDNEGGIPSVLAADNCGAFRYGDSYIQHKMLHSDELHAMGFSGKGVLMGMLDNGFRWRWHEATKNADVQAEFDFVYQDSITANEPNDVYNQDTHGTAVFSTICAWEPDSLIGVAPFATFLLSKTEDMRFERRIEEDNYAAGLEWMESRGADLSSASVGYSGFDSTEVPYDYDTYLDGKTTIAAQALNHAVSLGMVCVTAAGNAGGFAKTLMTPADADSAITVGAYADDSLHVASFTSKGPNAAGSLKPEIAGLGVGVRGMSFDSPTAIARHVGTSFATPISAGAIALLINAFPEIKPYEVRRLLQQNASQTATPDNAVGYGQPNFMQAAENYGIVISPASTYPGKNHQYFVVYIRSAYPIQSASIFVANSGAPDFKEYALQPTSVPHQYYARIPFTTGAALWMHYYISVNDAQRSRRLPLELSKYYSIEQGETTYPCGIAPNDMPTTVYDDIADTGYVPRAIPFGTVSMNLLLNSPDTRILIHDAIGREVYNGVSSMSTMPIPMASLARGLYTISILSAGNNQSAQLRSTFLIY